MINRKKLLVFAATVCALTLSVATNSQAMSWGGCYDLEIIAQTSKQVSSTDNNGHRIFILMNGNTKIMLQEGAFGVIDYNGTDGTASFSLPSPVSSTGRAHAQLRFCPS